MHADWPPVGDNLRCIQQSLTQSLARSLAALQCHHPAAAAGAPAYDQAQEREGDVPFEEQLRGLENVIKAGKVGWCADRLPGTLLGLGLLGSWVAAAVLLLLCEAVADPSTAAVAEPCLTAFCFPCCPPGPPPLQVRYVGVSNETSYGVMKFIQVGAAMLVCSEM